MGEMATQPGRTETYSLQELLTEQPHIITLTARQNCP